MMALPSLTAHEQGRSLRPLRVEKVKLTGAEYWSVQNCSLGASAAGQLPKAALLSGAADSRVGPEWTCCAAQARPPSTRLGPDPVLQQHADRGNEGERLIQHHVVLRLGHFDNGSQRSHQLRHVGCGIARYERASLAEDQGGAAGDGLQGFAKRLAETPPADCHPVELPGPPALDRPQRVPRDEFHDEVG